MSAKINFIEGFYYAVHQLFYTSKEGLPLAAVSLICVIAHMVPGIVDETVPTSSWRIRRSLVSTLPSRDAISINCFEKATLNNIMTLYQSKAIISFSGDMSHRTYWSLVWYIHSTNVLFYRPHDPNKELTANPSPFKVIGFWERCDNIELGITSFDNFNLSTREEWSRWINANWFSNNWMCIIHKFLSSLLHTLVCISVELTLVLPIKLQIGINEGYSASAESKRTDA